MSDIKGPQMIRRGEVRAIRQLSRGVQAQVCLGATARKGSAVVTVDCDSPKVMEALKALQEAVREETFALVVGILNAPDRT